MRSLRAILVLVTFLGLAACSDSDNNDGYTPSVSAIGLWEVTEIKTEEKTTAVARPQNANDVRNQNDYFQFDITANDIGLVGYYDAVIPFRDSLPATFSGNTIITQRDQDWDLPDYVVRSVDETTLVLVDPNGGKEIQYTCKRIDPSLSLMKTAPIVSATQKFQLDIIKAGQSVLHKDISITGEEAANGDAISCYFPSEGAMTVSFRNFAKRTEGDYETANFDVVFKSFDKAIQDKITMDADVSLVAFPVEGLDIVDNGVEFPIATTNCTRKLDKKGLVTDVSLSCTDGDTKMDLHVQCLARIK